VSKDPASAQETAGIRRKIMSKNARNITGRKMVKFGDSQEKVRRVPFGLGAAPGTPGAAEKCIRCSFGNIPVIEEVVWTIPIPLTADEALATLGDTVNLLSGSSSVPGVASIDSTFLINGILQTDILAQGVGVHVFCDPMSFSTIGNAFSAPDTTVAPPPSPDVWTSNDLANGALGPSVETDGSNYFPAVFEFGADVWRAGWNFINAYQFQWKTSQRELVLNELASDVSYFGSFADAEASGTSEVPIIEFVAAVNATYRSKGSATIFLPANFRRVGSVNNGSATVNVGIFHPTRDFDLAPVTWGGVRWQGYGCRGQMYRPIESPCFLERGIPIGMLFVVQDAVHQALMLQAMTINNDSLGTNISPDDNLTCTTTVGAAAGDGVPVAFPVAGNNVMLEQTLDSVPVLVQQATNVCRQVFKGGILKLAIKIKGWEMPGGWKAYCQTNMPQIMTPASAA
jgi:hypothetical protein